MANLHRRSVSLSPSLLPIYSVYGCAQLVNKAGTFKFFLIIAEVLHPVTGFDDQDREGCLRCARNAYRKDITALRAHLGVFERHITAQTFGNFNNVADKEAEEVDGVIIERRNRQKLDPLTTVKMLVGHKVSTSYCVLWTKSRVKAHLRERTS